MREEQQQKQYLYMDTEELKDLILELREKILMRIKKLSHDFHVINELQAKRDKAEERLAELGGNIGSIYSRRKDWGEEEEEEEKEEE